MNELFLGFLGLLLVGIGASCALTAYGMLCVLREVATVAKDAAARVVRALDE